METPPIVSAQEWATAHQELLAKEKELTRAHDALAGVAPADAVAGRRQALPIRRA